MASTASSAESFLTREKTASSEPIIGVKKVLFIVPILPDGFGDLGHGLAIGEYLREHGEALSLEGSKLQPVYIIGHTDSPTTLSKVMNNLKTNLPVVDENIHLIPYSFSDDIKDSKNLIQFIKNLEAYYESNVLLQKQVKDACGLFVISANLLSSTFSHYLPKMITYIGEYRPTVTTKRVLKGYGVSPKASAPLSYHMGLELSNSGMLLKIKEPLDDAADKAKILAKVNPAYLSKLIAKEGYLTEQDCLVFLQNSPIIPGYFKEAKSSIIFMQSLAMSEQLNKFTTLTFHNNIYLSKANVDLISKELLSQNGFSNLIVIYPDKEDEVIKLSDSGNKTLRILSGHWLSSSEFSTLYQVASFFGAGSGDKTFEEVFSCSKLIPFLTNPGFKRAFFKDLECIARSITEHPAVLNYINLFSEIGSETKSTMQELSAMSIKIAGLINTSGFKEEWERLVLSIQKEYNFYDKLPNILTNNIAFHEITDSIIKEDYPRANCLLQRYRNQEIKAIFEYLFEIPRIDLFKEFTAYLITKYKDIIKKPFGMTFHSENSWNTLQRFASQKNYEAYVNVGFESQPKDLVPFHRGYDWLSS